jgi:hypothetical protein
MHMRMQWYTAKAVPQRCAYLLQPDERCLGLLPAVQQLLQNTLILRIRLVDAVH